LGGGEGKGCVELILESLGLKWYLFNNICSHLLPVLGTWSTVNGEENLMTKMQEVSLNYHFSVEQRVGSAAYGFFGFNGKNEICNGWCAS
jgi:hypothetical protein